MQDGQVVGGQGETNQTNLPTVWDKDGRNLLWRVKVPGVGNSSPILWGDNLFLTSSDAKGTKRLVHCFNRADGSVRWTREVPARPPEKGGVRGVEPGHRPARLGGAPRKRNPGGC